MEDVAASNWDLARHLKGKQAVQCHGQQVPQEASAETHVYFSQLHHVLLVLGALLYAGHQAPHPSHF